MERGAERSRAETDGVEKSGSEREREREPRASFLQVCTSVRVPRSWHSRTNVNQRDETEPRIRPPQSQTISFNEVYLAIMSFVIAVDVH